MSGPVASNRTRRPETPVSNALNWAGLLRPLRRKELKTMEISMNDIGLVLNIIGTLLIAFAFGKHPKGFGGTTSGEDGKEYHFSYLVHPLWFRIGVGILIFGFLIQLSLVQNWLT